MFYNTLQFATFSSVPSNRSFHETHCQCLCTATTSLPSLFRSLSILFVQVIFACIIVANIQRFCRTIRKHKFAVSIVLKFSCSWNKSTWFLNFAESGAVLRPAKCCTNSTRRCKIIRLPLMNPLLFKCSSKATSGYVPRSVAS